MHGAREMLYRYLARVGHLCEDNEEEKERGEMRERKRKREREQ